MAREQILADGLARLEEIGSHRHGLHACSLGDLGRRESLQVDEVEYFPLALRKIGDQLANNARRTLAIYTPARIGRIDVAQGLSLRRKRQTPATLAFSTHLRCGPARDPVQPRLERSIRAILIDLAMR